MPIKLASIWILYTLLCKLVRPFYAAVSVMVGACLSATYLSDISYDYNPMLMFPCLLAGCFIMKYYEHLINEDDKKFAKPLYSGLLGLTVSILCFSKQSIGLAFLFASALMLVVLSIKFKNANNKISFITYIVGLLIGALPAVIYFTKNDCWSDFMYCMTIASGSKGGNAGLLTNLFTCMSNWKMWFFAIILLLLSFADSESQKATGFLSQLPQGVIKNSKKINIGLELLFLVGMFVYFYRNFAYSYYHYFSTPMKMTALIAALILFALLLLLEYKKQIFTKSPIHICLGMLLYLLAVNLSMYIISIFNVYSLGAIYDQLSVITVRRLCITVLFYFFFAMFLKDLIQFFRDETTRETSLFLMFETLVVVHFLSAMISANAFEEIFSILYGSIALARILEMSIPFNRVKNALILAFAFLTIPVCLMAKILIPYDWQGWRSPSITADKVACTVPCFEGYLISEQQNTDFSNIVNLIYENTNEDDEVLQFANMPLFNVLTDRKTPGYGAITWFDVCPDSVAEQTAAALYENPPKMIVWHNLYESEWDFLEVVFRNGNESGQRKILEFYNSYVQDNYEMIYEIDNHRDGTIQLWVRE